MNGIAKNKSSFRIKLALTPSVLSVVLFILFLLFSVVIAKRVFSTNRTEATHLIEARSTRQAGVVQSQFISLVSTTEAFSGAINAVFNSPPELWEDSFKEIVKDCVARIGFDSAWIVLEPEIFGEKTAFCFVRLGDEVMEDEISGIDDEWYFKALNVEHIWVDEDVMSDTINGKTCLTTSAFGRISTPDGKIVGVAGIDIVLENLAEELDGLSIFNNANVSLVNSVGTILTTDNDNYEIGNIYPIFAEQGDLFRRREEEGALSFKNGKNLVTLVPITYDRLGNIWNVVVETPMSEVNSSGRSLLVFILTGFFCYLIVLVGGIGAMMLNFRKIRNEEKKLGASLSQETQNLVVAAKENADISQNQNAAVKEIVSTMENTNELSQKISEEIESVNSIAQETTEDVMNGEVSLNSNMDKLREISEANRQTIKEIEVFSEEINDIGDIVALITNVADQAKIIAFNSELEAASAGEAGKNFHIVATEVRRLADGIIDSIKEIKEKIDVIRKSFASLLLASNNGTAKVKEGVETAEELKSRFNSIKRAAETTATSAREISTIIQQQTEASGQILIALKRISEGVEDFSAATEGISSSAENLKFIAKKLNEHQESSADIAKK